MNRVEADALATKIAQTWRTGAHPDVWAEVLLELDAGTAGTAYVRLRREADRAPSIARFLEVYRMVDTSDITAPPRPHCDQCDRAGWVPVADRVLPDERVYTGLVPCNYCETGRGFRKVHQHILTMNGRQAS